MPEIFARDWTGEDWQNFARRLVQARHGPQNVQEVPATVMGDAGIDFFTTDGCAYQCYAPAQSANTAKASSAMKGKATRDLNKLQEKRSVVAALLGSIELSRWILLCPFLDDKSVIVHLRTKEQTLQNADLSFLTTDFRVLVQSALDFESELRALRMRSLGFPLDLKIPTDEAVAIHSSAIDTQIDHKLQRGFPRLLPQRRNELRRAHIRAHLTASNMLDQLKCDFPDLWEAYRRTVRTEELRLAAAGPGSEGSGNQLASEQTRLESQLSSTLQSLERPTITAMAVGVLATWLIECPLDFDSPPGDD